MLRILLIEDEFIIAKDISILLEKDDFAVVSVAQNREQSLELFNRNEYDLIISDINLNEEVDGIEIIKELSAIREVPVVYLTAYSNSEIVSRAEKTMPFAYLLKPYNNNQLKATLNLAILNFSKKKKSIPENKKNSEKLKLLTTREKEVLVSLSTGKISKEVADVLNISTYTVEQHKKNIRKKLSLNTLGEMVNFALTTRLLEIS